MARNQPNENDYESHLTGQSVMLLLIGMTIGVLAAILVLPKWLPDLAGSLSGPAPKVYWYLSRATAFVSMGLLWGSMMLGVGITNKMSRLWPGAAAAFALHEYLSLLGLGFAAFHGIILLGDQYMRFSLLQVLVPFATWNYYPLWTGLGQLCFYAWGILAASFYIRKHIGQRTWRFLHFVSFVVYLGALVHGIKSGSDTGLGWVQGFYWLTGGSFLFLFIYRIVNSLVLKVERSLASPVKG